MPNVKIADPKSCQCGEVLKGVIKPWQCKVFGTACTPETPLGALMVSSEGACAAYYQYGGAQASRGRRMNVAAPVRARTLGRVHVPTVTLAHGGGGKAMKDLIDDVFVWAFDNPLLAPLDDQARFDLADLARHGDRLAFTTDSFVVDPLIFPGGDIGKLAVCGTVNDLAVGGAVPLYLSCAAIVEEGVTIDLLRQIAALDGGDGARGGRRHRHRRHQGRRERRLRQALSSPRPGSASIRDGVDLGADRARPGDVVLVNGLLGDHGAAILGARGDMALETPIESDCAPLHGLSRRCSPPRPASASCAIRPAAAWRRCSTRSPKPRRSRSRSTSSATPIREEVQGFCEILGLDPLYLANEGKIVAIVPPDEARGRARGDARASARAARRDHRPSAIGEPGRVTMRTVFGGRRHRRHAGRRAIAAHLLRRAHA